MYEENEVLNVFVEDLLTWPYYLLQGVNEVFTFPTQSILILSFSLYSPILSNVGLRSFHPNIIVPNRK